VALSSNLSVPPRRKEKEGGGGGVQSCTVVEEKWGQSIRVWTLLHKKDPIKQKMGRIQKPKIKGNRPQKTQETLI